MTTRRDPAKDFAVLSDGISANVTISHILVRLLVERAGLLTHGEACSYFRAVRDELAASPGAGATVHLLNVLLSAYPRDRRSTDRGPRSVMRPRKQPTQNETDPMTRRDPDKDFAVLSDSISANVTITHILVQLLIERGLLTHDEACSYFRAARDELVASPGAEVTVRLLNALLSAFDVPPKAH